MIFSLRVSFFALVIVPPYITLIAEVLSFLGVYDFKWFIENPGFSYASSLFIAIYFMIAVLMEKNNPTLVTHLTVLMLCLDWIVEGDKFLEKSFYTHRVFAGILVWVLFMLAYDLYHRFYKR